MSHKTEKLTVTLAPAVAHDTTHTLANEAGREAVHRLCCRSRPGRGTRRAMRAKAARSPAISASECAGTIRSQRHACVKKISAARGAELVGTQLLSPAPVPSASPQDVRDLARAQTPGPPGGSQDFFVYGDRRDYVDGKSLPAWTEASQDATVRRQAQRNLMPL